MIEWGAYVDGSMPAVEKAALDERLKVEPALARELDGYRQFLRNLSEQAAYESVPHERLDAILSGMPRVKPSPWVNWGRWLAPVAAAAALAVFALNAPRSAPTVGDVFALAKSPPLESKLVDRPIEAARWVREKTGWSVRPIDLSHMKANLACARYGDGWACYDYKITGGVAYLYISKIDNFDSAPQKSCNGKTMFVGEGLGWRDQGMSYYVVYPNMKVRERIAEEACAQTCKTVPDVQAY